MEDDVIRVYNIKGEYLGIFDEVFETNEERES